jgi:hypothetical protein
MIFHCGGVGIIYYMICKMRSSIKGFWDTNLEWPFNDTAGNYKMETGRLVLLLC